MKIVSLCGPACSGKDTAFLNLPDKTFHRYAFADYLKSDLRPLLEMVGCDTNNSDHKKKARNLLVEWGRTARAFIPDFWIDRLFTLFDQTKSENVIITDVRYCNEIRRILELGGKVIKIIRPGYYPANEEEKIHFSMIDSQFPELPYVINDGTPEELGAKVMGIINGQ